MKLMITALALFATCAFAKNQESPGNPGTMPSPPNRYPTRMELLSAILNSPQLVKLQPADGHTLQTAAMQFPRGEAEPLQINVQLESSNAKFSTITLACARVDYTDVPGKLSDGTEAVKLADQWAFIRISGGGCN